ncbi:MAG: 16S rRNA (guanine(527)-N(7))-methyltransferase RsmG [Litoreibacter sp.]|uniref:16S rRNA (guanine(527)-N(7))-methyltransferase RsmG n=1 Tax=Litoreibacter sp. TaxID=1969459 RepID=UPI003299A2D1
MSIGEESFANSQNVSRETLERLKIYEVLLTKWTSKINLVSKSTIPDMWTRHFLDSAQVFSQIPKEATKLADFGSGGGFPGLVVAAISAEKLPELSVVLIESDLRKASFLMAAAREMGVEVDVLSERVENAPEQCADVVTARALAPLVNLLEMTEKHLKKDGTALFLKGASHEAELDMARNMWDFNVKKYESVTSNDSALLQVNNLRRA